MKALGQLPPELDDNASAARLYTAMDSDGDGFIAWAEWAKMSDGEWARIMASAKEAVSPIRNPYPELVNPGAADAYNARATSIAQQPQQAQPQPRRSDHLRYARCENVKVNTVSEAAAGGICDLVMPPAPKEMNAGLSNYNCAEERQLLKEHGLGVSSP